MTSSGKRFMVMAGGTGGHVFPGLAVADELREAGHDVQWVGTEAGIEHRLVPEAGIKLNLISISGVRGKGIAGLLKAPFRIIHAVLQARRILKNYKPACVLGMGGFVAGPGSLAAKLMGIPVVVHEQNAVPGTTNRIASRFAVRVLEAFPNAFESKVGAIHVGNPVRKSLVVKHVSLIEGPLKVLVLGGSLGAKALNEVMPEVVNLLGKNIELWHQCGKRHADIMQDAFGGAENIRVSPFIDDMNAAYSWADVVVCRAGAMTVSELAAVGLPAIFVPYPYAIDDHQTANAKWLVDQGGALMMQESEMSAEKIVEHLQMLSDRERLQEMSEASKKAGITGAAEKVASICEEVSL